MCRSSSLRSGSSSALKRSRQVHSVHFKRASPIIKERLGCLLLMFPNQQQWIADFEALKNDHHNQRQEEPRQAPSAATTSAAATEFPQARIVKIAKLTPSVKKASFNSKTCLSAEGARYLNLATAAALRQFTLRSLSGRENEKTLTLDDILAMLGRGGTPLKFLQECKYVITDNEEACFEKLDKDRLPVQVDEQDAEPAASSSSCPRPQPIPTNTGPSNSHRGGSRAGRGLPVRTADIATFFRRA
ncbi:hypothetical protein Efla_000347 [Eimeria flavescens]